MNPELEKRLQAYALHLQQSAPVTNYGHAYLASLWQDFGRSVVDTAITLHPAFQLPCRKPYSIQ